MASLFYSFMAELLNGVFYNDSETYLVTINLAILGMRVSTLYCKN